jgi:hypothetical protein
MLELLNRPNHHYFFQAGRLDEAQQAYQLSLRIKLAKVRPPNARMSRV